MAQEPTEGTGYTPYFYQAGQYLWKPYSGSGILQKLYSQPSEGYSFSSETPSFHHPQTVEQIIKRGYLATGHAEPETAILTDKQRTFWQGLDDIIQQVRSRYQIYEQNIYQIELGKCYTITDILSQETMHRGITVPSKEHYRLTKQLHELYQQEREERVRLWQDISKLKLKLPEAALQYLSAWRKVSILQNHQRDVN
jgi:hypothetical protein